VTGIGNKRGNINCRFDVQFGILNINVVSKDNISMSFLSNIIYL